MVLVHEGRGALECDGRGAVERLGWDEELDKRKWAAHAKECESAALAVLRERKRNGSRNATHRGLVGRLDSGR